jgi:foldase protein PrsA
MRTAKFGALLIVAAAAGIGVAEWIHDSPAVRDQVGKLTGRGELLAFTGGLGIYESDRELRGAADTESLVIEANLRRAAAREVVENTDIDRELQLLKFQFGDEEQFTRSLQVSGLTEHQLRDQLAEHLRARQWLERQIASQPQPHEQVLRDFFTANGEQFVQPQRYRVSHVFVAAPAGTPAPLIEEKRKTIDALAARVAKGETVSALAAEASEDLATKARGGDLGFFAASRMPEDFMEQVQNLSLGQASAVVQTSLGFHILELTDSRPARELPFEEVREEVAAAVRNQRRAEAADEIAARFGAAEFIRTLR